MKLRLLQLTVCLAGSVAAASLTSCQSGNQLDQKRLAEIGDLALSLAERSGQITPAEAALAREAGKLILTPSQPVPAVEVTATK